MKRPFTVEKAKPGTGESAASPVLPPLMDHVGDHREAASCIPYGLVFGAFAVAIAAATVLVAGNATAAGTSSGPTPAYLITQPASVPNVVLIDQDTGQVTVCTNDLPAGQCNAIGTITPDSSATPLMSASILNSIFILNTSTGSVAQCTALTNGSGSCRSNIGTIPQSAGDALEMLVAPGSVFVIDKTSGGVLQCNDLNSNLQPKGSCRLVR